MLISNNCLVNNSTNRNKSQIKFDRDLWESEKKTERYRMYDDMKNNVLIGKNNSEIESLLGEKEYGYDPDGDSDNSNYYWCYTIDEDFFEGDEMLLVEFKNDVVVDVDKVYLSYL